MRFYVIACEVLFRELSYLAALSPHVIDFRWISQGLHDQGTEKMQGYLQKEIDSLPEGKYDAVLMAYGLCNNGTLNLSCPDCKLVIPRTHDCIALLMGSRRHYREYFDSHPGTYFLSLGWIERDDENMEEMGGSILESLGSGMTYADYVEKYGEEEAQYLAEELGDLARNYSRLCYIRSEFEDSDDGEKVAAKRAEEKNWEFDTFEGSLEILRNLLWAQWDKDFLVLDQGRSSRPSYDDHIFSD